VHQFSRTSVLCAAMAKPACIQLFKEEPIAILYEDRSILAIDKPAGWMLVPFSWQRTNRNLQAAIISSIGAGHFWARSRGIWFLKYVHRLDAETTGVLLLAKSQGALESLGALFETRQVEKVYLAVTDTAPRTGAWTCSVRLSPDPEDHGLIRVDRHGKEAETAFRLVASAGRLHLIEARPLTGRQHQIRIHLAESGCPIVGDDLYGRAASFPMGLRAVGLAYSDPFTREPVTIRAPHSDFLERYGFPSDVYQLRFQSSSTSPPAQRRKPASDTQ
jgi:RluA family pseudouridine synthase